MPHRDQPQAGLAQQEQRREDAVGRRVLHLPQGRGDREQRPGEPALGPPQVLGVGGEAHGQHAALGRLPRGGRADGPVVPPPQQPGPLQEEGEDPGVDGRLELSLQAGGVGDQPGGPGAAAGGLQQQDVLAAQQALLPPGRGQDVVAVVGVVVDRHGLPARLVPDAGEAQAAPLGAVTIGRQQRVAHATLGGHRVLQGPPEAQPTRQGAGGPQQVRGQRAHGIRGASGDRCVGSPAGRRR